MGMMSISVDNPVKVRTLPFTSTEVVTCNLSYAPWSVFGWVSTRPAKQIVTTSMSLKTAQQQRKDEIWLLLSMQRPWNRIFSPVPWSIWHIPNRQSQASESPLKSTLKIFLTHVQNPVASSDHRIQSSIADWQETDALAHRLKAQSSKPALNDRLWATVRPALRKHDVQWARRPIGLCGACGSLWYLF